MQGRRKKNVKIQKTKTDTYACMFSDYNTHTHTITNNKTRKQLVKFNFSLLLSMKYTYTINREKKTLVTLAIYVIQPSLKSEFV